ncbi:hypothetical protein ZWY2020_026529 [Hordeum vulgare]|nr:hypothetical protein ZWY2020_026529 [Hordeum vulgare]
MRRETVAAFLLRALLAVAEASGEEACDKGWECSGIRLCSNGTIIGTDGVNIHASHFEELFPRRNDPIAHASGFWNYRVFIAAAALFEPRGFGTTGGREVAVKEVAAFLAHVGVSTSFLHKNIGRILVNFKSILICREYHRLSNELYRCVEGVEYYGRGALPVYWNYNYGIIGKGIKQDLLSHPELLEQNATLAFEAAIWSSGRLRA